MEGDECWHATVTQPEGRKWKRALIHLLISSRIQTLSRKLAGSSTCSLLMMAPYSLLLAVLADEKEEKELFKRCRSSKARPPCRL